MDDFEQLKTIVQNNCHIVDAQYSGNYTMCIYLLKMRELYRWEHHLFYHAAIDKDALGLWLVDREKLWEQLQDKSYQPLLWKNKHYDPFGTVQINPILLNEGLVYSGGLGKYGSPHFFLGKLDRFEQYDDYQLLVSSTEYARDLTSPPGMSLNKSIFVRKESLRRLMWEKYEGWLWNKPENALKNALSCYDFASHFDDALDQMTNTELESVIWHEIGEIKAGKILGEKWTQLLMAIPHCKVEMMIRTVRDHLADCLSTMPKLATTDKIPSIHFYFSNLTPMRKKLFPEMENIYQQWFKKHDNQILDDYVCENIEDVKRQCLQIIALYDQYGDACVSHIEKSMASKVK